MEPTTSIKSGLVGRERELAILLDRFGQAEARHFGVTLVAGEPGIGKSRLLDEFSGLVQIRGAVVLRSGATEAAGMPPYLPFIEALDDFGRAIGPESLRRLARSNAGILATIVPSLSDLVASEAASGSLPIEQAKLRLFESVTALLQSAAERSPIVLILDDLQWGDPATFDLLVHLARRLTGVRVAMIGAYREGDIGRNAALARALAELNRLRISRTFSLNRLDVREIQLLATQHLGAPSDDVVSRTLLEQSEGNPFFVEELLRAWRENGVITVQNGRWRLTGPITVASSILDAIEFRLTDIPAETIDLLRIAAVIGRNFATDLVGDSAGCESEAVEAAMALPERLDIVRSVGDRGYRFTHDMIRECLYRQVTPTRRRRLHGFIGRAIEQHSDAPGAIDLAALAYHYARSGDRARGGAYAAEAMRSALASFALDDAIAQGRVAHDLLASDAADRGAVMLALAETLVQAGQTAEAIAIFQEVESWFEARNDRESAARASHGRGDALWRLEAIPEARAAFERAIAIAGNGESPIAIRTLIDLGSLMATSQLRTDEGIELVNDAVMRAVRSGDAQLEVAASRALGNLHVRSNRTVRGIPLLEHALQLAEAIGDPAEVSETCACLLTAAYWTADGARLEAAAWKQIAAAGQSHDLYQLRHVYAWLAAVELIKGNPARSDELLVQQEEIVERLGAPEPRAFLTISRAMLTMWRGDYAAAELLYQEGISRYRALNEDALLWHAGALAAVLYALGRIDEAAEIQEDIESRLAELPRSSQIISEAIVPLVPIAIGQRDEARIALYTKLLTPFSGGIAGHLIDRALAALALASGELDRAAEYIDRAERLATKNEWPYELAMTLRLRAELTRRRGALNSGREGRRLDEQADEILIRIGTPNAGKLPVGTRSRPAIPTLPAGLSEREGEVLRLVAAGLSNREIAQHLFISEKTVANHLTSIFVKTDVENRVAAAAFAIRHGL